MTIEDIDHKTFMRVLDWWVRYTDDAWDEFLGEAIWARLTRMDRRPKCRS